MSSLRDEEESSESTVLPHTGLGLGKGGPWNTNGSTLLIGITLKPLKAYLNLFTWLHLQTSRTNSYVGTLDMSCPVPTCLLNSMHTYVPAWDI